jgi:membrane protein YdbS with pleckstrin-like domain
MTMNGLYVAAWVALIVAAVHFIPKALRYDRWLFEIDNLDDEELAAALKEFPDLLDWRAGR